MKLRNKKTGKIIEWFNNTDGVFPNSLAELNEEWEDYEESRYYWFIDDMGNESIANRHDAKTYRRKIAGNYFETEEEAKKAVEKLKAWKRLKDKGIEFYGWQKNHTGTYDFLARWKGVPPKKQEIINELDLLFGGEE